MIVSVITTKDGLAGTVVRTVVEEAAESSLMTEVPVMTEDDGLLALESMELTPIDTVMTGVVVDGHSLASVVCGFSVVSDAPEEQLRTMPVGLGGGEAPRIRFLASAYAASLSSKLFTGFFDNLFFKKKLSHNKTSDKQN